MIDLKRSRRVDGTEEIQDAVENEGRAKWLANFGVKSLMIANALPEIGPWKRPWTGLFPAATDPLGRRLRPLQVIVRGRYAPRQMLFQHLVSDAQIWNSLDL